MQRRHLIYALAPLALPLAGCSAVAELAYDIAAQEQRQRCDQTVSMDERRACRQRVDVAERDAALQRAKRE